MLTEVRAGAVTIRGVSVGGVYTSLAVPELGILFDVGMPARSLATMDTWLISHGHTDHIGAMAAQLGVRALQGKTTPPRVLMPAEIVDDMLAALASLTKLQRWPLAIEAVGVMPGDELSLRGDLRVRAVKTFHPVPSLGYIIVRNVAKLKPDLQGAPGAEIAARRRSGEVVSIVEPRLEFGYATDTLISVLDHSPELLRCQTLMMESTFLDARKSRDAARAGCHVHLDDIIERADAFMNNDLANLVLMHFSQIYRTDEIDAILRDRLPPPLYRKVIPFCDPTRPWPG
jgi:ribonuclease Z